MKKELAVVLAFIASTVFAGIETVSYTLPADYSTAKIVPSDTAGYVVIGGIEGMNFPYEPAGAPMLPETSIQLKVPKNGKLLDVTYEATWKTIASEVSLLPIQPPYPQPMPKPPFVEPNVAQYAATWPMAQIEAFGVQLAAGQALLPIRVIPFRHTAGTIEAATSFTVKARFLVPESMMAVRQDAQDKGYAKTDPNQPDYILIAPNMYYSVWNEYVEGRKTDHPELKFLCKNFNEILNAFPINTDDPNKGYYARNDAERLHAYIRQEAKKGTHYFVLAGAWYDGHGCPTGRQATETRKKITMWTPTTGVVDIGPNNGLPGVYTVPRNDNFFGASAMPVPSDAFYACCDLPNDAKYPWDEDENGLYLDEVKGKDDLMPDVVVTRMNIRCGSTWRSDHYTANYEDIVRDYLAKVRRAENKDFPGRERYLGSGEKLNGYESITSSNTIRDEMEYYAGAFNLFAQYHDSKWTDGSYTGLLLMRDRMGKETPVVASEFIGETKWNTKYANRQEAIDGAHAQDWELGFVQSHGSQGGATAKSFMCDDAQNQKGLMANFVCASACFMSCPDWTDNDAHGGGSSRNDYCSSLIENRDGGAAFTVGNSRYGWGGAACTNMETGDGLSQCLQLYFIKGVIKDRLPSGDAWLQAMQLYDGRLSPSTGRWCWAEVLAFGDPLISRPMPEDVEIKNASSSVALPKTIANDVTVSATQSTTLTIGAPSAAMSLTVIQGADNTFTISGNETFRVSTNITVSAGNLTLAAPGGVGHGGIVFKNKGDLRFEANERFYPAKIVNAGKVTLAGANTLLDFRSNAMNFDELVLEGNGLDTTFGNILRGTVEGALTPYLPLAIENQELRLETINAFKDATVEKLFTLKDARLVVGTNPNFGLGYDKTFETFTKPIELESSELKMDGVTAFTFGHASQETPGIDITVKGASKFTSDNAGHLGLIGKSHIYLEDSATLEISSEMKDMGEGGLIFEGTGSVNVLNANALAGEVEVDSGVTIGFSRLPLTKVTKLTIKSGAKVILPKNASGIYQITPLVGAVLTVAEGVTFYNGVESEETKITGATIKSNGSFYDAASLLVWNGNEGADFGGANWTLGDKTSSFTSGRGVLFQTIDGVSERTINVAGDYLTSFGQFVNDKTTYRFVKGNDSAHLTLSALAMGGLATFEVPLQVTGSLDVMGGEMRAEAQVGDKLALNASEVHVYPNATLGATRAGSALETFKFMRIYFLSQKNATKVGNQEGVRLEEICFYKGDKNLTQGNIKTISCVGGNVNYGTVSSQPQAKNLNRLFNGSYDANSSIRYDDYSVFIMASAQQMSEGKVYLDIELNSAQPLFDYFGVFAAKYSYNGSTWDGFQPNKFRVEVSADGTSWFKAFEGGSDSVTNRDQNPTGFGGWIGSNYEKSFTCQLDPKRPMELELMNGAKLLAEGAYHANIAAEEGAILKAVEGKKLVTDEIDWSFPATPIKVDTTAITVSETPQAILSGENVTFETLYYFEPINSNERLTYADHTISVVSGDGMAGPYSRTFNGVERWNTNTAYGWYYNGTDENGQPVYLPFTKAWSEHALEQNVDILINLSSDSTVTLDADVVCDTLKAESADAVGGFSFTIADGGGKLNAQTLDFSEFSGEVTCEVNCGEAHIIAGPITRLSGGGTGLITASADATVILTKPWEGEIEGNCTVILDPGEGKKWTDLSVLKYDDVSSIVLNSGTMNITEGTEWIVPKLSVHEGAAITTAPTSSSWVLNGKNVTVDGTLEINADAEGWMTKLDYSKIAGTGTIAYVSDSGTVTALPTIAAASTLKIAIGRGNFEVEAVSVPGITIKNGATFSATSLADSSKIRYVRIYFFAISSGSTVRLSRIRFSKNGQNISWHGATVTASQGTTFKTDNGVGSNDIVNKDDPNSFELIFGTDNGVRINTTNEKMEAGECYITIRVNNAVEMFDAYSFMEGLNNWGGYPTAWKIQVSTDGNEFITVDEKANVDVPGYDLASYGGAASRVAPLNVETGGALLAKGEITAKITLADGAIIKPAAGQTMTLTSGSELILPESGKVTIDISALTVNLGATVDLITGKEFTDADLAKFTVLGNGTGYRLVLGQDGSLKLTRTHFAPKILVR